MMEMTSRVIVALGAATIVACSHDSPAGPSDIRDAKGSVATEVSFAASSGQTLAGFRSRRLLV